MEAEDFLRFALTNRCLFINKKNHYADSMLGQVMKIENGKAEILWYSLDVSIAPKGLIHYSFENFYSEVDPFLVVKTNVSIDDSVYNELKQKLPKWNLVINKLYEADQHRLKLDDCIKIIEEIFEIPNDLAICMIKVNIPRDNLTYKKISSGEYICLSVKMIELENRKRYLSSVSDEIQSKSERISYIIRHGQTVGNYREKLFISVLKKYIPKKFHVATGFIEGSHKQIDIIIYDQHNYLPIFREDDLVVVKRQSVIAVIEIKTTLNQKTLLDSLDGIENICEAGMCSAPFFKGVFAFNNTLSRESFVHIVEEFYRERQITTVHHHVDVICVQKEKTFFVDYNNLDNDDPSCPTLFEINNLNIGESFFLQKLFSHLDVDPTAKKINQRYFEELEYLDAIKQINALTEDDWVPLFPFFSEDKNTLHLDPAEEFEKIIEINRLNVKKRIRDINEWMSGDLSREELVLRYNNQ